MIDKNGYRYNVAIIVLNSDNNILIAKRLNKSEWQFPQGGINKGETIIDAMYRELNEEIGLEKNDVTLISQTDDWLYYDIPKEHLGNNIEMIGQKQIWFLLRLKSPDSKINLKKYSDIEFDGWCWITYWESVEKVISFKKNVYKQALHIFEPIVFTSN